MFPWLFQGQMRNRRQKSNRSILPLLPDYWKTIGFHDKGTGALCSANRGGASPRRRRTHDEVLGEINVIRAMLADVQRRRQLLGERAAAKQVGDGWAALHDRLVSAYRDTVVAGWHAVKPDGYYYEHL
jgi:hypothetical protein